MGLCIRGIRYIDPPRGPTSLVTSIFPVLDPIAPFWGMVCSYSPLCLTDLFIEQRKVRLIANTRVKRELPPLVLFLTTKFCVKSFSNRKSPIYPSKGFSRKFVTNKIEYKMHPYKSAAHNQTSSESILASTLKTKPPFWVSLLPK